MTAIDIPSILSGSLIGAAIFLAGFERDSINTPRTDFRAAPTSSMTVVGKPTVAINSRHHSPPTDEELSNRPDSVAPSCSGNAITQENAPFAPSSGFFDGVAQLAESEDYSSSLYNLARAMRISISDPPRYCAAIAAIEQLLEDALNRGVTPQSLFEMCSASGSREELALLGSVLAKDENDESLESAIQLINSADSTVEAVAMASGFFKEYFKQEKPEGRDFWIEWIRTGLDQHFEIPALASLANSYRAEERYADALKVLDVNPDHNLRKSQENSLISYVLATDPSEVVLLVEEFSGTVQGERVRDMVISKLGRLNEATRSLIEKALAGSNPSAVSTSQSQ